MINEELSCDGLSDDESEELNTGETMELNIVDLIDIEKDLTLYQSVVEVEQDHFVTLAQHPHGLFSMGFSTCYAVIVRSIAAPFKDVALAHVFDPGAIDFQLMISSVASDNKVTIEIARSKQEYTVQYHDEPGQLEHPNKYFKKTDRIYQNLFMKNFEGITSVPIYEMPNSVIVIDEHGQLDFLRDHRYLSLGTADPTMIVPVMTVSSASSSLDHTFFADGSKKKSLERGDGDYNPSGKKPRQIGPR